jgi:hypothetical protein
MTEHEWQSAKILGYEDDAVCRNCGVWHSDAERFAWTECPGRDAVIE